MNIKKRGLSDVVTTVLIILLVLAAVAMIWGYLSSTINDAGSQITTACLTLDLMPKSCQYFQATNTVMVNYGRDSGQATLQNVSLVLTVGGNDVVYYPAANRIPKALESFTFNVTGVTTKPTQFTVAGRVTTESGSALDCPVVTPINCI